MKKTRNPVQTLCILSLLTAVLVLLTMTVSIQTPYFKLSLGSLPVVLAAMLYGPLEGALVAVLGEFLVQILGPYGLTPTTVIWIWPPAIRALVVGSAGVWMRRRGTRLEARPPVCYAVCIVGAVLTTIGNTFGARPSATYACTLGTVCHNASTPYFESNIGLSAPTVAMLNVAPGMLRGS